MKKIITLPLLLFIKVVFRLFDELIPKSYGMVIFASKSGKLPNANILEVWNELKFNKQFHAYLVTRNKNDACHLNLFSVKGVWRILRSKYVFLTHGPGDVIYAWYGSRKIVTYIGHGVPLKSFFLTNTNTSFLESFLQKLEVPGYNFVIATSEADQKSLMKCFKKVKSEVLVTGLPRNDLVLSRKGLLSEFFPGYSKYMLYAPTHRDKGKSAFFPFSDRDLFGLNQFLVEKNYIMVLRGHVNNKGEGVDVSHLSNIKILTIDAVPEIQYVLADFDLLITDYSSIYIDFLLTQMPILFIPYDLQEYLRTRGMLYDYNKVAPGPHIFSQSELIESINKFMVDPTYYQSERLTVKKIFHEYEDSFSKRIITEVLLKTEKK